MKVVYRSGKTLATGNVDSFSGDKVDVHEATTLVSHPIDVADVVWREADGPLKLSGTFDRVTLHYLRVPLDLSNLETDVLWVVSCGLTDFDAMPRAIGSEFRCSGNPLTSLKGAPLVPRLTFSGEPMQDWLHVPKGVTAFDVFYQEQGVAPILALVLNATVRYRARGPSTVITPSWPTLFRKKLELVRAGQSALARLS